MKFIFPRNMDFLKEIAQHTGVTNLEVHEIGDGILVMRVEEDYDVFFDTGRWTLEMVLKKGFELTIYPLTLPYAGVLPGRLFKGGVKSVERALFIVKEKLAPRAPHYKLVDAQKEEKETPKEKPFDFSSFFRGNGPFDIFR